MGKGHLMSRQPRRVFKKSTQSSKQGFPSRVATLLHQALHFLRARTRCDKKSVWHVNDNQIVDSETGDQSSGPRNNNPTGNLLCENCEKTVLVSISVLK